MTNVVKVSLQGSLPGGEVFSVNPVWNVGTSPVTATDAANIAAAIDAVTIPTDLLTMMPSSCAWTGNRVEARTDAGVLLAVGEHKRSSPVTGSTSNAHPPQTSMVVSLRGTLSGARRRGRLYFPAVGTLLLNTNLRFSAAQRDIYLAAVKAYLALVEDAIQSVTTSAVLVVWSRTDNGTTLVTQMLAGDVPDVQRRRRDALIESYGSVSWP